MYNDETDRYTSALYSLSPDMPREDWITIALAFSDAVPGDAGFIVFDQWSQAGSTYKPVDTKAVWKSCKPGKVKAGTLIHSAKAVGWEWTGERPTFAPPTAEELQARQLQEQQAAREAEAKLVEASKKARAVIGAARAARADHPYLISKGVGIDANLRELPVEQIAERLRYHPQSSGQPLQGRVVIATIQLIENGYLQTSSIEMIDEAGRKTAMAGGKKKDGFTTLGTIPRGGKRIYLCEGIATGLSIREATREPVICALSCGNLLSVAQTMKAQYPTCQILVAAELNKETGLPEPHANDAALVVGGAVAIPVFSGAREPGQTDFNDMHHAEGIKAVRASLSAPTEPAVPDTSLSDIAQDVRLEDGSPPDDYENVAGNTQHDGTGSAGDDEPEQILPDIEPVEPYPLELLGTLLGDAAKAIAETVDTPFPIAAHSVLSVASFAAQSQSNVEIDGRIMPLSLFLLTVAESGDRKSACDRVASAPLNSWQRQQIDVFKVEQRAYQDEMELYQLEKKAALGGSKSGRKEALSSLFEPVPPRHPIVICQEPTLEGLQKSFMLGRPSQALFNDEGAQFFGGHAMNPENCMKTIAGLSKYWDGTPISRTRSAAGESGMMFDRRLSIHLQVQPIVAEKVLGDELLTKQGILARFLLANAQTLAGTRYYKVVSPYEHPAVKAFHHRLTDLMERELVLTESGGLDLAPITHDTEAKEVWVAIYNRTEENMAAGMALEAVSKAGENANRIAGIFAVIEGTKQINKDQMTRAWKLVIYYLEGSVRGAKLKAASKKGRDASEVLEWIRGQSVRQITINQIQMKVTPIKHRKSVGAIRQIMEALTKEGKVKPISTNSKGDADAWELI